ncbi:hypothetical protein FEM08_32410 [Flavobacterium gilvum]|nr:hypothetical protein FEM08_32410 [Flavobacterium gilvum]
MSLTGVFREFTLNANSFYDFVLVYFEFGIYNYVSKRGKQ